MSEVATRTPSQELVAQVRSDQFREQIQMALPENMPPSRFVRATVTALMQNADLAKCEPDSLFTSLIKCAQDGLLPDGREAAIVPFGSKATYMVMIGGLRKVVAEYGWQVRTAVVYEADEFNYELGLDVALRHIPAPVTTNRGKPIAAYAIAIASRSNLRELEVMTVDEIEKVRNVSRAKNSGPWKDWWDRMAEKTVARRLIPKLALDPADKRVAGLMVDAQEIGPERSAELLYGPGGQAFAAKEIGEGTEGEGRVRTSPGSATTASAAEAVPSLPEQDPASPEEESQQASGEPPLPPEVPGPSFPVPEAVVTAAGETQVPRLALAKGAPDVTLAEITASQDGYAREYFTWAIGQDFVGEPEFKAALGTWVQAKHPDIWAGVNP